MIMKCIQLIICGRVQGVFFRDNTRRKAIELGLKGYVKNLPNENVEAVAQGDEDKLQELIDFIRKNPGMSKVTGIETKNRKAEKFESFEIRH